MAEKGIELNRSNQQFCEKVGSEYFFNDRKLSPKTLKQETNQTNKCAHVQHDRVKTIDMRYAE